MEEGRPAYMCHECGALHAVRDLPSGVTAVCRQCGATLYRERRSTVERALALTLAAVVLFIVAQSFPFMTFSMEGNTHSGTIIGSAIALWDDASFLLAVVVATLAIVVPLIKLLLELWVLLPLALGRAAPGTARLFSWAHASRAWAMTEVYLLAILVAYVKLVELATITIGPGLIAFAALIVTMAAADNVLDRRAVWWRLMPQNRLAPLLASREPLGVCHTCAQVLPLPGGADAHCPRCGTHVHYRKPDSIARTWALTLAAALLYIPANVLPVMTVTTFGNSEADTIISGVVTLAEAGMWPVALLVFFASITVPLLKLLSLVYLLVSVQLGAKHRKRERTLLYRIVEQVGRWSMIDIFMIAILAVLVDLGQIARIEPGAGAAAFAGVVIITIFAAESFDPRSIWDRANEDRHAEIDNAESARA